MWIWGTKETAGGARGKGEEFDMLRMRRIPVGRVIGFGFVVGSLLTASGLAGVAIDPLRLGAGGEAGPDRNAREQVAAHGSARAQEALAQAGGSGSGPSGGDVELDFDELTAVAASTPTVPALPDGEHFLVGASRATLNPTGQPAWRTTNCTNLVDPYLDVDHAVASMEDMRGWPAASPDCIYLGGYGIGPARAAQRVGHGGVWVRAMAISNGTKTFVYAVADTVGWFARYDAAVCSDCGILDVRERIAADVEGIDLDDVIIGSTHTHAGADTYGGWGGIPDWYRAQIRDAALAASKQAIANLQPAQVTAGKIEVGERNRERRDTYYSNADAEATWIQATASANPEHVIATWATFGAHPVYVDGQVLHADWPGATARRFEAAAPNPDSVGLLFEGGLGNLSPRGAGRIPAGDDPDPQQQEAEAMGVAFADAVLGDIGDGGGDDVTITDNAMATAVRSISHPATTNPGLITLTSAGLFDREFTPGTKGAGLPGEYSWAKPGETSTSGEENDPAADPKMARSCVSAGPTVITTAGSHKIGPVLIAFTPGEIFSNIAEVVKEQADAAGVVMVLGQTNDALGYIIQSFEYDTAASVPTHYGSQTHEYEEVFSIDRCFGDHVLETVLETTGALGFGR